MNYEKHLELWERLGRCLSMIVILMGFFKLLLGISEYFVPKEAIRDQELLLITYVIFAFISIFGETLNKILRTMKGKYKINLTIENIIRIIVGLVFFLPAILLMVYWISKALPQIPIPIQTAIKETTEGVVISAFIILLAMREIYIRSKIKELVPKR